MTERKVAVGSADGLHARTASRFVQAAARQPAAVRIAVDGRSPVPATSLLSVLSLGAVHGAEVTLSAEGDGAEESLAALAELLAKDLDAEEPATGDAGDATNAEDSGTAREVAGA